MLAVKIAGNVISMKPKTKLKRRVAHLLKVLQEFPQDKVPTFSDGNMDVAAFNNLPEIVKAKNLMREASITILGEDVICREWFQDNGFLVAGLVLSFDLKTYDQKYR